MARRYALRALLVPTLWLAAACAPVRDTLQPAASGGSSERPFWIEEYAASLDFPWEMAWLPDGRMLLTERKGKLKLIADGKVVAEIAGVPEVMAASPFDGLLDVTLDPAFAKNGLIYWSYSEPGQDGANNTAVARGTFVDGAGPRVDNVQVIFHQTPSLRSTLHFGSRLVWGRDGTLFITMGDRSITEGRMQAQRMDGLLGKIARINADGSIPKDNPFVGKAGVPAAMWSFGHRNIQSATLHPTTGELWEVEHGTRGGDEINIARKGKDYGWPTIAYGIEYRGGPITGGLTAQAGMEQPLYYWDPIIGPSGMAFYTGNLFPAWKGSLFVGGHGTRDLVRLTVDGEKVTGEERLLVDQKDAVRDVRQGPDGALYIVTDGAQGRVYKLVP